MKTFDVFVRCPCGHKAHMEMNENPLLRWQKRTFVCSKCAYKDPKVEVWARWIRAFKGDPADRL